ncbi:hypothetical protein HPP92_020481 [Vanilla planifolia]|uniref:Uncharacterized protein n=1 Tax=Vanilla planifolia TaxID=51239 RepID=A0A835PX49_VANPL|nr:hypothetical protein HPP92_020481 [Vanilla planifolia]
MRGVERSFTKVGLKGHAAAIMDTRSYGINLEKTRATTDGLYLVSSPLVVPGHETKSPACLSAVLAQRLCQEVEITKVTASQTDVRLISAQIV